MPRPSALLLCSLAATAGLRPAPRTACVNRRGAIGHAMAALASAGAASASAAEKRPSVMGTVADIDAAAAERNADGEPTEHVPRISFEAGKVVFTVPHETLAPPNHVDAYVEYMWLKDASTGKILAAKRFRGTGDGSIPAPTLVASVPSGSRVTAASKCSRHGVWQGTFKVP